MPGLSIALVLAKESSYFPVYRFDPTQVGTSLPMSLRQLPYHMWNGRRGLANFTAVRRSVVNCSYSTLLGTGTGSVLDAHAQLLGPTKDTNPCPIHQSFKEMFFKEASVYLLDFCRRDLFNSSQPGFAFPLHPSPFPLPCLLTGNTHCSAQEGIVLRLDAASL